MLEENSEKYIFKYVEDFLDGCTSVINLGTERNVVINSGHPFVQLYLVAFRYSLLP